jgi:glycosidase
MVSKLPAESIDLGGPWRFARDEADVGLAEGWASPEFDDSAWGTKTVPGDWGDFDGIGWYRREVDLPDNLNGRGLYLLFEGVDDQSRVWVNGEQVAECMTWNRRFFANLTAFAGQHATIAVRVVDLGQGGGIWRPVRLVLTAGETELFAGPLHHASIVRSPAWLPGSVICEVFVRDFSESGDFEGLRARIPELRRLGVDIVWLMPIHPIGEVKRKGTVGSPYAVRDHMAINPDFGTEEDLRNLVRTVHESGMKIIIDAVLNHSSPDDPLTETHPDWYVRDAEGHPIPENADWYDVVDFDWSNHEVWQYFFDVLEHWVRDFDIDGYRCDVASLMPTEFWEEARTRLQAIKPDMVMLAESDDPALHLASFDLTYNWALYDAMVPVFAGRQPAADLGMAMRLDQGTFPVGALRMAFAENHDKERAPVVFGGFDQARAAALIALAICPCPLIYNGEEAGETTPRDIFEKIPIDWSDPHGMRAFFERLLAVRRSSPALLRGELNILDVEPPDAVFAFSRTQGDAQAVVVVNVTNQPLDASGEALIHAFEGVPAGAGSMNVGIWRPESGLVSLPAHGGDIWLTPAP